jgi:type III pantothenate kinase
MRILFLLIVLANVWMYTLGQGMLGTRPADQGRVVQRVNQELNANALSVSLAP